MRQVTTLLSRASLRENFKSGSSAVIGKRKVGVSFERGSSRSFGPFCAGLGIVPKQGTAVPGKRECEETRREAWMPGAQDI